MKLIKNQQGLSNLLPIILVSAITLLTLTVASLIVIDETKTGSNQLQSLKVFAATDGCMEEALLSLKNNSSYTGETLTIGDTSCIITVSGSDNTRTIITDSTSISVDNYTRKLQSDVTLSPFSITSWQDLSN